MSKNRYFKEFLSCRYPAVSGFQIDNPKESMINIVYSFHGVMNGERLTVSTWMTIIIDEVIE